MPSVFSLVPRDQWVAANDLAFATRDPHPVSEGHTLVVARREVATWFEATSEEQVALLALVDEVKAQLDEALQPDGYNVGFDVGEAAGQTVFHLHLHVIPRFFGDMDDPRGGVRHVIPHRGNPLARRKTLSVGGGDPFIEPLRELLVQAERVRVVCAFVQESGVRRVRDLFQAAMARGADIQLLTGDYLDITQAAALEELLDWASAGVLGEAETMEEMAEFNGARVAGGPRRGRLETRVVEVERLVPTRVFHPKSWRFEGPRLGALYVGSSNLSWSALEAGVEWNLRIDRDRDPEAYRRAVEAFEGYWGRARVLDAEWLESYAARARPAETRSLSMGELEPDELPGTPSPHEVQIEALEALERTRDEGHRRGLVVLATGLGKTWLAAFDVEQVQRRLGRTPRLLFVAHRKELLRQAARTFRQLARDRGTRARLSWCIGPTEDLSGDWVFASVAKLARADRLARIEPTRFDYLVIDEVHHATAPSYRRILDHFDPIFSLGLTATPERADEADLLGLFDDNLAYRADLGRGVEIGRLVPFRYQGLKDDVDYDNIPWRNRRFDPAALATAVQTEQRMEKAWEGWNTHPGTRTLVFCASIEHANFCRDWLRQRGVRVDALHTGAGGDDREGALEKLAAGDLDAVCSVDVLNEGIDVPSVDRVLMLRPTESPVVFLQQLGRGLRKSGAEKAELTVIDFVGNHRLFVHRLRQLLSLASGRAAPDLRALVETGALELPSGCALEVELEAKEMLEKLLGSRGAHLLQRYRALRDERGERPTAGELYRLGIQPRALREAGGHASWFELLEAEGDLTAPEASAAEALRPFLQELERTHLTKSFKMVTIEALLEAGALFDGLPVEDLARRAYRVARRSPELWTDVAQSHRFTSLDGENDRKWLGYWQKNPIAAWTGAPSGRRPWFVVEDGRFRPGFAPPPSEARAAGVELVRELVDYRLAQVRARRPGELGEAFEAKLITNGRDPILKLPDRKARPDLPEGDTLVRLPSGDLYTFAFVKIACNVAYPLRQVGRASNALPDLLRGWFGPQAGQPGTVHRVRFSPSPDGWWVEPLAEVIPLSRGRLRTFPSLRAAAGAAEAGQTELGESSVVLPSVALASARDADRAGQRWFAVRAAGTSMEGGKAPIHDGDWVVMEWCRGLPLGDVEDRVVLVQIADVDEGLRFQLKRVRRRGTGFELDSDNPASPSFEAHADTVPIARKVEVIRPEALAPPEGSIVPDEELAAAFALDEAPEVKDGEGVDAQFAQAIRAGGHLFLFVDRPGALVRVDRLRAEVRPAPGETAYVWARASTAAPWRYCGVGRWEAAEGLWTVPSVDYGLAKSLGAAKSISRTLPPSAESAAREAVGRILERTIKTGQTTLDLEGRRLRILGPAPKGGLRIDGGEGGFGERTVSELDFGWCLEARARATDGTIDQAFVNRLRFPEGTPKASTRYIDTGWALRLLAWSETLL